MCVNMCEHGDGSFVHFCSFACLHEQMDMIYHQTEAMKANSADFSACREYRYHFMHIIIIIKQVLTIYPAQNNMVLPELLCILA